MIRRWCVVLAGTLFLLVATQTPATEIALKPRSVWRLTFGSGADFPLFRSADGIRPLISNSYRLSFYPSSSRPFGYWCDLYLAGFSSSRTRISVRTAESTIFGDLERQRAFLSLLLGVEWTSRSACPNCWRPRLALGGGIGLVGTNQLIHVDGFCDTYPLNYDSRAYSLYSLTAVIGLMSPEIFHRVSLAAEISITDRYTHAKELAGLPKRHMLTTVGALLHLVWDIKR
ncbi:MAG: hypothetical protein HZB43_02735 [candidate division Zixibacteria bacterium]|nr:hypothetical protein [candidate division Zixibacteria bacterium]